MGSLVKNREILREGVRCTACAVSRSAELCLSCRESSPSHSTKVSNVVKIAALQLLGKVFQFPGNEHPKGKSTPSHEKILAPYGYNPLSSWFQLKDLAIVRNGRSVPSHFGLLKTNWNLSRVASSSCCWGVKSSPSFALGCVNNRISPDSGDASETWSLTYKALKLFSVKLFSVLHVKNNICLKQFNNWK